MKRNSLLPQSLTRLFASSRWINVIAFVVFTAMIAMAETPERMLLHARGLAQDGVLIEAATLYEQYLKLVPNDDEVRFELARLLWDLRKYSEAETHLAILHKRNFKDERLGEYSHRPPSPPPGLNQYKQLPDTTIRKKPEKKPAKPLTALELARLYHSRRQVQRSIDAYGEYLKGKPDDEKARLELAHVFGWNKLWKEANAEIDTLLSTNPQNLDAILFRGDIEYWQGNDDNAIDNYRHVLQVNPGNTVAQSKIDQIFNSPWYKEKQLLAKLALDNSNANRIALARMYLSVGRIYEADSVNMVSLKTNPLDSTVIALGDEIRIADDKDDQRQAFENRRKLINNPRDTVALRSLLIYYNAVRDYPSANEACMIYLSRFPRNDAIRLERANILFSMGKATEAVDEYRKVVASDAKNRNARLGMARALLSLNRDLPEVESVFRNDLSDFPRDRQSQLGLAQVLLRENRLDEAKKLFQQILENGPDDPLYNSDPIDLNATDGLMAIAQREGSNIDRIEERVKRDSNDVTAMKKLVGIYLESSRFEEAQDLIARILKLNPNDAYSLQMKQSITNRIDKIKSEELKQAQFKVQDQPFNAAARHRYGRMLSVAGRSAEALQQYRELTTIVPDDPTVQTEYAELLMANKQNAEARVIYEKLSRYYPANYDYHLQLARLMAWSSEFDRAVYEYEQGLCIDPNGVDCLTGLGDTYRWKAETAMSSRSYRQALVIQPENRDAISGLNALSRPTLLGEQGVYRMSRDNYDYRTWDAQGAIIGTGWIDHRLFLGGGNLYISQHGFSERAPYGFFDYQTDIDPETRLNVTGRFIQWYNRESGDGRVTLDYIVPLGIMDHYLTTSAAVERREAIFEVASVESLLTWNRRLWSTKVSVSGSYLYRKTAGINAEIAGTHLDDNTWIVDAWMEPHVKVVPFLFFGARGEIINADTVRSYYWTPDHYTTTGAWVMLKNEFPKWNYQFRGDYGAVLHSTSTYTNFSVSAGYHLSSTFTVAGSYFSIKTKRSDGVYRGDGVTGSLNINF